MLIAQKDGFKVFAVADGTVFGNPYETETKNGKPCVRFTLQYDSVKQKGGTIEYKKVVCICAGYVCVDIAKTLKNREFVAVLGTRIPDRYMSERTGKEQYAIFCSSVIPTKRLMKAMSWIEEQKEYEKKIYKDVLHDNPMAITYDGEEDEPLDVDF